MLKVLVLLAVVAGLLICAAAGAGASVIYVNYNSPNDGPGNDWNHAFQTVQAGLNAANSGDEVWVAKGTYVENINLTPGAGLYGGFAGTETARSQRNWNANVTILDGNQNDTVVSLWWGASQTTCIDGFTIQNGLGWNYGGGILCESTLLTITNNTITGNTAGSGGGIGCDGGSSVTITNNTITGNAADSYGGGIDGRSSSVTITNNTITGNSGFDGAGIFSDAGSSVTITNNTITGNNGVYTGGGIDCGCSATITNNTIMGNTTLATCGEGGGVACCSGSPTVTNNTITGNTAYQGGGIFCYQASPTITNNTIAENSANIGGGIYCDYHCSPPVSNSIIAFNSSGIYTDSTGAPVMQHDDVFGNTAYGYSGMTDPTSTSGNIAANPLFVNSAGGNYRLSTGSPCINAGINSVVTAPPFLTNGNGSIVDLDGNLRIVGGTVDMGCYEWQGLPSVAITFPTTTSTYLTNSSTVALSGTASGNAGIAQVMWSNNTGGNGSNGICAGTTSWSATGIALQPGGNVITVTATDSAGNTASAILTVTYDNVPPTGTLSINSGAQYTNTTLVNLTLSATDNSGTVGNMWICNDAAFDNGTWQTYATSTAWTLSPGDGLKTVYVLFEDPAGNISSAATASITLDTTPPQAFTPVASPSGWTTGTVQVSFATTDSGSGISHYEVSLDSGAFAAATSPYTVSTEGNHTVSVKAVDNAGNSITESASALIDRTPPSIASITITPTMAASGDNVIVTVSATDSTGIVSVTADGTTLAQDSAGNWAGQVQASGPNGVKAVNVTAFDHCSSTNSSGTYSVVPVIGTAIKNCSDPIASSLCSGYIFKCWGKVTIIDSSSFWLDDGSPQGPIKVIAPGYADITDNDYVCARGILAPAADPITLTCPPDKVMKIH